MKKRIGIAAVLMLTALMAIVFFNYSHRVEKFFSQAHAELEKYNGDYDSVMKIAPKAPTPLFYSLESGSWYAVVLEHACCSGAGFDAVMIKDSEGHIYTSRKNYCGYEGFGLGDENIRDLRKLRETLKKEGYQEIQVQSFLR